MGANSLPATLSPVSVIQTEAEYEATVARFWDLVGSSTDLPLLLALRESLRAYEHRTGIAPPVLTRGRGERRDGPAGSGA